MKNTKKYIITIILFVVVMLLILLFFIFRYNYIHLLNKSRELLEYLYTLVIEMAFSFIYNLTNLIDLSNCTMFENVIGFIPIKIVEVIIIFVIMKFKKKRTNQRSSGLVQA